MSDVVSTGLAWLTEQRAAYLSRDVVYSRGASTVTVAATVGKSEFEETDSYGVVHRVEYRDYIIPASGFEFDEVLVIPRSGDRIVEAANDRDITYVVACPTGGQCYSEIADRTALRVHTVQAGEA